MAILQNIAGRAAATAGTLFGLPEMGVSERYGRTGSFGQIPTGQTLGASTSQPMYQNANYNTQTPWTLAPTQSVNRPTSGY